MERKLFLGLFFTLLLHFTQAQVGINILNPDSNAVLHLEADDKGLLLPRLTTAQMNAMQNPTNGLTIYNTEDSLIYYFNNECWLKAYQKTCNDCEFVASLSSNSGTIDHVMTDSVSFTVDVLQTNGNSDISVSYIFVPPTGMQIDIDNPIIDSVGSATFSIDANIFTQSGTYPIIVQVSCDQAVMFLTYILELTPCYEVDLAANAYNVNLQADYNLPGVGQPVCVIAEVFNGVEIASADPLLPALNMGALDPQTHVGLKLNGAILGKGGNGASLGNLANISFAADGENGGNALELTTKTTFLLNGAIYGGGGGGGGIGAALDASTNVPIIGTVGFCLAAGTGGGGGSAEGVGGGTSGACPGNGPLYFPFTYVQDGTNATAGQYAVAGAGGQINQNFPIPIPISIATLTITPSIAIAGGNGGDFGQTGGNGTGSVGVAANIQVAIPIIGTINVPLYNGNFPLVSSNGGAPGLAVKTNGNTTIDLVVPNNMIKGDVQP